MLSKFVERTAIKEAYKANAARIRLPFSAAAVPVLAPSKGEFHSAVGAAFDYLARFKIARDVFRQVKNSESRVDVWHTGWLADDAVALMKDHPDLGRHHAQWSFYVQKGHELLADYVEGKEVAMDRAAKCAQFLGNVDILCRLGADTPYFNPKFKIRDQVQSELMELEAAFDPLSELRPKRNVLLNPKFSMGHLVGGADADIMVDGTIIDMKTTGDIGVSSAHLRKLLGYAVLHQMGGADLGQGEFHLDPCEEVGTYFARHGVLVRFAIDEILPGDGFQRFSDAFAVELPIYAAEMENVLPCVSDTPRP